MNPFQIVNFQSSTSYHFFSIHLLNKKLKKAKPKDLTPAPWQLSGVSDSLAGLTALVLSQDYSWMNPGQCKWAVCELLDGFAEH